MALERLSASLWEERVALERMLFKLEEEHLVLASGMHHWLPSATAEVEEAMRELSDVENGRIQASYEAALELGLPKDATLREISDAADEKWSGVFADHRSMMQGILARIGHLVKRNKELLARGIAATADALTILGAAPTSYDTSGHQTQIRNAALMIDARA